MKNLVAYLALVPVALSGLVGCAPADVAGDYTVNLRNGMNGCGFDNWTEGDTSMGIPVIVRQTDSDVTLDVEGVTGGLLDLFAGSSMFMGDVGGTSIDATLIGERSANMGGCNYTITIDLTASLDGDALAGELAYRPVTNHHPDCGALEDCTSLQTFNGTRPPSE
ncbi:MAG: hypothetical protein AB7S26_29545 [Sandaracinaceae bacterium]